MEMKNKYSNIREKMAEGLYKAGYTFSKISVNTKCCCIFHQPTIPESVRKLRHDKKNC